MNSCISSPSSSAWKKTKQVDIKSFKILWWMKIIKSCYYLCTITKILKITYLAFNWSALYYHFCQGSRLDDVMKTNATKVCSLIKACLWVLLFIVVLCGNLTFLFVAKLSSLIVSVFCWKLNNKYIFLPIFILKVYPFLN